jgi:phosphatidylglycerophosphate synthase
VSFSAVLSVVVPLVEVEVESPVGVVVESVLDLAAVSSPVVVVVVPSVVGVVLSVAGVVLSVVVAVLSVVAVASVV